MDKNAVIAKARELYASGSGNARDLAKALTIMVAEGKEKAAGIAAKRNEEILAYADKLPEVNFAALQNLLTSQHFQRIPADMSFEDWMSGAEPDKESEER